MKTWHALAIASLAFLIGIGVGSGSSGTSSTGTTTVTETASAQVQDTAPVSEPAKQSADIKSDLHCDYNISTSSSDVGGTFIAGGTVENDGDKAGRATVIARWSLLGSAPARASKTVRVAAHRSREVQLSAPATIDQISAYQSGDTKCRVTAR